jgi:hypothetical protein
LLSLLVTPEQWSIALLVLITLVASADRQRAQLLSHRFVAEQL